MISSLVRQEIENIFQVVHEKSTGDELVFLCPECGDQSGHRSLNLQSELTFCFRCNKGANNKGNFFAWARALGFTFTHQEGGLTMAARQILLSGQSHERDVVNLIVPTTLPRGFTSIARDRKNVYTRLITKMAVRKNLDYEAFVEADAGYTEKMPWEPYCIFPVYDYGTLVYYQGRTYVDTPGETTKKFPSRKEVPYGAAYWVYNIDEVRAIKPPVVILVESILNVLSLRRKLREVGAEREYVPVCVFKHYISKVQALKLQRCREVREFCVLFDHDATNQTWGIVSSLTNKVRVSIAEMPMVSGNKKSDANDDVDAAWEAIKSRKRYTVSTSAFRRTINIGNSRQGINGDCDDLRGKRFSSISV